MNENVNEWMSGWTGWKKNHMKFPALAQIDSYAQTQIGAPLNRLRANDFNLILRQLRYG